MKPTPEQIKKDIAAFKKGKTGITPDKQRVRSDIAAFKASKIPKAPTTPIESDKGFVGNMATDMLKLPARLATNLAQAGKESVNLYDVIRGKKSRYSQEDVANTKPFSGTFLGDVKPVGGADGGQLSVENLKDSLGAGLEAASYIPIAKTAGIGFQVLKGATKKGGFNVLKQAAKPLIKEGFVGGALEGAGSALQENKSLGKTAVDTAVGGITGGIAAPVFGAGAATAGRLLSKTNIPNLFKGDGGKFAKQIDKKNVEGIIDMTRDINTSGIGSKNGKKTLTGGGDVQRYRSGDASDPKLFKGSEPAALDFEIQRANAVSPYLEGINVKKQPIQAVARLNQAGAEFANNTMTPFLTQSPARINFIEMNDFMRGGKKPQGFGRDVASDKVYEDVVQDAINILKQETPTGKDIYNPNDINNARKKIDNLIKQQEGESALEGSRLRGIKAAGKYIRNRVNELSESMIKYGDSDMFALEKLNKAERDFLDFQERGIEVSKEALYKNRGLEGTPEGERLVDLFKNYRNHQKAIIESADNIAINAQRNQGRSIFKQTLKENPVLEDTVNVAKSMAPGYLFGRATGRSVNNNPN